jgi:hypothetical protein
MAETVRKIEYFYATVEDKPGEGRRLLEFLSAHGVNLISFTAFPVAGGRTQLDFVTEDPVLLQKAAGEAGFTLVGPKKALMIQGDERIGVLAEYHLQLANAGINVHAANGISDGRKRFGFILWVKREDYEKAAQILGAK